LVCFVANTDEKIEGFEKLWVVDVKGKVTNESMGITATATAHSQGKATGKEVAEKVGVVELA
jgi:hypothetical protein